MISAMKHPMMVAVLGLAAMATMAGASLEASCREFAAAGPVPSTIVSAVLALLVGSGFALLRYEGKSAACRPCPVKPNGRTRSSR